MTMEYFKIRKDIVNIVKLENVYDCKRKGLPFVQQKNYRLRSSTANTINVFYMAHNE